MQVCPFFIKLLIIKLLFKLLTTELNKCDFFVLMVYKRCSLKWSVDN